MFTDDDFVDNLPKDPIQALDKICNRFFSFHNEKSVTGRNIDFYNDYLDALGLTLAFCESYNIGTQQPSLDYNLSENINSIHSFFTNIQKDVKKELTKFTLRASKEKFKVRLGRGFVYEFSAGDFSRVQELVNKLREEISKSDLFKDEHKERLLKRLEVLQAEIHKKMSSFDKFWGIFSEAGVALGKFGNDAKPFFDRITEIMQIVWRTQARAEELESGKELPFFIADEDKKDE